MLLGLELLADTTVAEATGWGAIVISLVSAISAAFMAWNGRKRDKDKLDHEAKLKELELSADRCLKDRDDLRKDMDAVKGELAATKAELDRTRADLADCREKHKESVRNHESSQSQIGELRSLVDRLLETDKQDRRRGKG